MECRKCGAKWDVSKEMESKIKSCPFCGAQISLPEKSNVTFTEVVPCFKHIFKTYGTDIVENKGKFLGLLSDFFPSGKAEIRLIKIALDAGVYAKFSALKENEIEGQKLSAIMLLTDNYFVGKEHAEKVVGWIIDGLYEGYTAKAQQGAPTTAQTAPPQNQQKKKASSTQAKAPAKKQGGATSSAQKKSANASASPAVSTAPPPPPATGSVKGKFTFPEGIYDGEVVDGKREGYGTITYPDGTIYKGFWHKDKRNGKGTEYKSKGKKIYRGDFKNGDRHGEGTLYHYDGKTAKYEGSWLYGSRSGQGTEYNEDGSIYYQGEWSVDSKDGHGTLYKSNNTRIEGTWQHGFFSKGTYFYLDGHRYEGELSSFGYDREGKGVYYWPDGYRYEGEWHDGERHGQGIMYHKNGKKMYEGEWQDGKYHGQGTLYSKLGFKLYSGQWINGEKAK